MSHLSLETLARLIDEAPSTEEHRHLDACAACRAELDAMREDVHALSTLPAVAPTRDRWDVLEQQLVEEGLIRPPQRAFGGWSSRHMLQAAAALVLFVGGTATGRLTAGPDAPQFAQNQPQQRIDTTPSVTPASSIPLTTTPTSPTTTLASDAGNADATPELQPQSQPLPRAARRPVTLASSMETYQPQTVEEAAAVLQELDRLYLAALTRYAEMTSGAQQGDPVARLAALQSIVLTTQAALAESPADPVLNGVHLTAMAQRDATLRQVAANSSDRWY